MCLVGVMDADGEVDAVESASSSDADAGADSDVDAER